MSRIKLYQGDCLEVMRSLPDDSIDSVITDPPYGTTSCKWDIIIPLEEMWTELKRISKSHCPISVSYTHLTLPTKRIV